jgi:bacterioferritin-associated ferredoxin
MVVCLCRGLSDSTIEAVITAGASSVDELAEACGAGVDCRACCPLLTALVDRTRETAHSDAHCDGR